MAKKLNKKVAIIGIILLILVAGGGMSILIGPKVARKFGLFQNPEKALTQAGQALEAGDYEEAEKQFGLSYAYGKTDEYKIERLFELAQFHLIHNDQHEADWLKAMKCWNTVISIDTQNIQARRALLDFYYQGADNGSPGMWRSVREDAAEMIEVLQQQGTEPDSFLLIAHAKALLSIAQRGETTDRRTLLDECITSLNRLIELEPQNGELYKLMADAMAVQGELDTLAGVIDARKNAQAKAIEYLETGIASSDDKATAVADMILYKMQTTLSDPNILANIRTEIDERSKQIQPNAKFWLVSSIAYETPGKMSAESEINRAIESIRQAHELEPEDFEYTIRMARLMYRKGSTFDDAAAIEDAIQIAEEALSLEEVQDVPGPLRGRNINYRFMLNNFLAELYLEKAIAAAKEDRITEADEYTQKAEERIAEIVSTLGSSDNPTAQKYEGLVALAKGQHDRAAQILYKTYEQNKALDKAGEASRVDSRVCIALAEIAAQKNQPGMEVEFLLQVVSKNQDRFILQKPQLLLDYADVLSRLRYFQDWADAVTRLTESYQNRYGVTEQSQRLLLQVAIADSQYDRAQQLLAAYQGPPAEKEQFELLLLSSRISSMKRTMALDKNQNQEPTEDQTQQLEQLRKDRNLLLKKILQDDPQALDTQLLSMICSDLIQNDQADFAVECLDAYLDKNPDVFTLMVLRLQALQDDPLNLTTEQRATLQRQAIEALGDARQKTILLAEQYQSEGDYDKALQLIRQYSQSLEKDEPEMLDREFNILLSQKDIAAAETLQQKIRAENVDKCEGNLAAARLEIAKENYALALRRLDQCLVLQPLSSYTHFLKSQTHQNLNDYEQAIESAKTAIRMSPRDPLYARNLASLLFNRNSELGSKLTEEQESEAEQAIVAAVQLNPGNWQLQSVYAEIIYSRDPDRAISIRQSLLETNPTGANALMLANMALRTAQSEWDDAKKDGLIGLAGTALEKGIEIEPENEALLEAYADYLQKSGKEDAMGPIRGNKNLEWKFYLRGGRFDEAKAVLNELLADNPNDPLVIQGLVLVSQGAGQREQIKEYLELLGSVDDTKETELWILQKYVDNGFTLEAEKNLESFMERFPDEKAAIMVKAWVLMSQGQLDEALALANRYLESNTNNPSAWRLRGRLYRLMNQPNKAIDDLQRSKSLQDIPMVRIELATVYSETKQMTSAIGELVSSLDDPQAPMRMRLMLEGLYQRNNRITDLEKLYDSTLQYYPKNAFWHYRAGRYYLSKKDLKKAEALLKKSWDLSNENEQPDSQALEYYLETLLQSQQYDKVLSIASELVDTPMAPVGYTSMAQVHLRLGQRDKVLENFNKALDKAQVTDAALEGIMTLMLRTVGQDEVTAWISNELAEDANSQKAHILASALSSAKGDYNEAIKHIEQCLRLFEQDNPLWLGYALKKVNLSIMAYVKTSDPAYLNQAVELLDKMLLIQPNNSSLLNNMAYLLADNDQRLEEALEYARKAHQGDPGNAVYLDTYAYVQCKTGYYDQAEQNLIRALQIFEAANQPVPWDLYKHFGMAKEGLEQPAQAIEMYQKAMDASEQISEDEQKLLQEAIERLQQN
jgi:tetratricopeptide (TPR) repeat protein